jgi:GH35 family endo-1,4-beta-xylanase
MQYGTTFCFKKQNQNDDFKYITLATFQKSSSHVNKTQSILSLLAKEEKIVHAHSLIDKRNSYRFTNIEGMRDYLKNKISSIENVHSWDVLNEVIWAFKYMPDDWYLYALEECRQLQPNSLLFWNEYAIKDVEYWDVLMQKAEIAKERGLLDGVGIQRHVDLRGKLRYSFVTRPFHEAECFLKSWVHNTRLEQEIDRIHDLGLLCHLSEVSFCIKEGQQKVANNFLEKLKEIAERKDIWRFTYWGYPYIKVVN